MYISQCLIVKNEESNIEYCLTHLKSVVDEQIVVDTGSTDRTVEIAKELGAKVFFFDWINDFSAARNFALDKAKGDWIIFLDCDEYFSEESVPLIKNQIKKTSKIKNATGIICELVNIDSNKNVISIVKNISPRIFRKKNNIRYRNKVHEILYDRSNSGNNYSMVCYDDINNNLKIFHTGYDKKVVNEKDKNERNINIILSQLKEEPKNSKLHYYLAKQYLMYGKYSETIESGYNALKYRDKNNEELYFYPMIYCTILIAMFYLPNTFEKMNKLFNEFVTHYPSYPDGYWIMGKAFLNQRKVKLAIEYFEKCIHYCNVYNDKTESLAIGQIEDVYKNLLSAYILDNDKQNIVRISIVLLKTNKYRVDILFNLIKIFLSEENEEKIIQFLQKLYDYDNVKDILYLLKTSEFSGNKIMINYYVNLFNEKKNK